MLSKKSSVYVFLCVVTFEYSERKLLIGQFDLTHVKQVELESPDMFKNHPWLPAGRGGMFISSKIGAKSFRDGSQDICKDTLRE